MTSQAMNDAPTSRTVSTEGTGGSPLVLSVAEAAAALRISKDLAYELIARGELPALRLGRRVVVPTKALVELVDGTGHPNRQGV
jgi:excisionase family DNA binding protein